ncbi:MAG: hypothetical protein IAF38_05545 [Bacteroidia bacterium]|nr:hypothetical protein [Bacteroidia bacterium]
MIRYLEHKEIDKTKWDTCVENSAQLLPYGFSWFLDIVAEKKWNGLVLNDYEGVMPLPFKKKIGFSFIYQPFFTQQLGVFGKANAEKFIAAIPPKFKHIHTNLNWKNSMVINSPRLKEQTNLVLELDEDFEKIRKNFSENCTRNIKKTEKHFLTLNNCSSKDLISIFKSTRGKEIAHLKKENYAVLQKLIAEFERRKMARVQGVFSKQNELLGGAVIVKYKSRNIFFFSALSEEGKKQGGIFFFLLNLIKELSAKNNLLDFEGSNNAQLARFYRGFGATEQNYTSYTNNRLPLLLKQLKK